jgi:hypothetical protein
MTKPHRATPDDWAQQKDWANRRVFSGSSCILELCDRIEELEAAQQPQQDKLDRLIAIDRDFTNSLVERVADAIGAADDEGLTNMTWSNHSRAAILAVAAALLDWWDSDEVARTGWEAAKWLEQEASRG